MRNPNYGQAYYGRGMLKVILGDKNSGCIDLDKANQLNIPIASDAINKYCK